MDTKIIDSERLFDTGIYKINKNYIPLIYFVVIGVVAFINNSNISLWDQDEAAYAGFAKQMLETGDWSIPHFMWSDMHRKPPLHFWNICLSYKLFGINEFSVRFPSALFSLLTYMLIYFAGSPLFGKRVSFLGAVILSTTLFVPSLAKVSVTDATLLFFTTLCSFALIYIIQKKSFKWTLIFWISFSLAMLTKGPPIILGMGALGAIFLFFHPNRKNLISLHPWFFFPLAFLPLFLWGYFVSQKDGGAFINWMIDWYILKRVGGSVLGQTGPPGTHILSIFVFFLPYFMFLPNAFWNAISGVFKKDKGLIFILSAWFISGWFIFEWSPSKLPAYVVAAHVPLALLVAKNIVQYLDGVKAPSKGLMIAHFSIMILIFCGLSAIPFLISSPFSFKIFFFCSSLLLLISMGVVIYYRNTNRLLISLIGSNILFQLIVWAFLLPQVDNLRIGSKYIADYVKVKANASSIILIGNEENHPPSLPFYLGLSFRNVYEEGNSDSLISHFSSEKPCVLVLDKNEHYDLKAKFPDAKTEKISARMTDRDKSVDYYILINDIARLDTSSHMTGGSSQTSY